MRQPRFMVRQAHHERTITKSVNKTNLIEKVAHTITSNLLLPEQSTIIVGLSGGPDSVFLLHALCKIKDRFGWSIIAAHLNHGWRPDAENDEQFCRHLCINLQVPYVSEHARNLTPQRQANGSQEEQGRLLRRHFFEQLARAHNADTIALAHHQDDQLETFFIRLARGSGIEGLASMHLRDGLYVRPLLAISKQEILTYLTEQQIVFCTDSTNVSPAYLRNRIRAQLVPQLTLIDQRFPQSILKTIQHLQDVDDFVTQEAHRILAQHAPEPAAGLPVELLASLHPTLKHQVILTWLIAHKVPFTPTESFFKELDRFVSNTKSSTHTLYPTWRIKKDKKRLYLEHIPKA